MAECTLGSAILHLDGVLAEPRSLKEVRVQAFVLPAEVVQVPYARDVCAPDSLPLLLMAPSSPPRCHITLHGAGRSRAAAASRGRDAWH